MSFEALICTILGAEVRVRNQPSESVDGPERLQRHLQEPDGEMEGVFECPWSSYFRIIFS